MAVAPEPRQAAADAAPAAAADVDAGPVPPAEPSAKGGPVIDMQALVFAAFAPFVTDERLARRQQGWIERDSIDGIWQYLCRELLAAELADWSRPRRIDAATVPAELERLALGLRKRLFAALEQHDRASADDPRSHQRFISRLGGEIAYADYHDLLAIEDRLGPLTRLFASLPLVASGSGLSDRLLVDAVADHLGGAPNDAVFVAAGLANRVGSTGTLVKAAVALARSTSATDIRRSIGAPFLDLALSVIERHAVRFRQAVAAGGCGADAGDIQRFHEGLRAVIVGVDIAGEPVWRKRMADLTRSFSEVVGREIERLPLALRRAFRGDDGYGLSEADGIEAVGLAAIYASARLCRDSLAVNELIARQAPVVERAIETYSSALIAELRRAPEARRAALQVHFEHMVAVAGHVHGDAFAGCLRRSAAGRGTAA